jgi:nucleotidyltransferase/DNA polymerase involved in DNA repair
MMHIQMIFHQYFGDNAMSSVSPNTASASNTNPADTKQILLKDISSKWGKFSEQELGALKNKDDLITQVVAKYSIDKAQAQREVDAVMKGRQI